MQEASSPLLVDPATDYRNLTDILRRRVHHAPQHTAFRVPEPDSSGQIASWRDVSTEQAEDEVISLAKGLLSAGLEPGGRVAIMAASSYSWALADLAILYAGGVVVPVYETSSQVQVEQIVEDAGVQFAFAGTAARAETLEAALSKAQGQEKAGIWCFNGEGRQLADLKKLGQSVTGPQLEAARTQATLDDVATLVYTSGTTSAPKGVIITHRNLLGQVLNVGASYHEVVHERGSTVIFLPLAHVLARGLQFVCLNSGMSVAHLSHPTQVIEQLVTLRPTFLVVVPRVLEKIQQKVAAQAHAKKLGALWTRAETTALAVGLHRERLDLGQESRLAPSVRLQHHLFDVLFYRRIRALLGNRIEWLLSGGAPLAAELSLLFRGLGVPTIEGYGLTETTAPVAGNLPGRIQSGTVGQPIAGATIRVNDAGEVSVRGIGVFTGYTDPELTRASFDADGFFATGDLGELRGSYLVLKGRVKDVIVTSSGKTVYPFTWENSLEHSPLIAHAVMMGEGRNYLTALIVPDPEYTVGLTDQQLRDEVSALVAQANSLVSTAEQVKKFELVEVDAADPSLMTPTQKLKRALFAQRWSSAVERMYR